MKNNLPKILVLASFFLLCSGWADSLVYAQNQSESSIHEMPEADPCSVVIMHIRELTASLKQVARQISVLEMSANSASARDRQNEQLMSQDAQLKALKEKESALREQMYMQEQKLENCMGHDSPPKQ